MAKVGLKRWGAMMKFRNYCKRLGVEAKVYRAMGSDGEYSGAMNRGIGR